MFNTVEYCHVLCAREIYTARKVCQGLEFLQDVSGQRGSDPPLFTAVETVDCRRETSDPYCTRNGVSLLYELWRDRATAVGLSRQVV